MNLYSEFIFTEETKVLLPYVTQYGEEHTLVIDRDKILELPTTQLTMIDHNLRYNHSSLRGAKDSAVHILGGTNMTPIVMNAAKKHIWFPSEAYKNFTNVWLALHHIVGKPEPVGKQHTRIYLTDQWELIIPIKYSSFKNRYDQAHILRSHTLDEQHIQTQSSERKQVMLVHDGHRIEYKVKREHYEWNEYGPHTV